VRLEGYVDDIRTRYETLAPVLDERAPRWWAATEARSLGHGGILCVAASQIERDRVQLSVREEIDPEVRVALGGDIEAGAAPQRGSGWCGRSSRWRRPTRRAPGDTLLAELMLAV
jgi:hypothetical protein